jgi:hypothetical protein
VPRQNRVAIWWVIGKITNLEKHSREIVGHRIDLVCTERETAPLNEGSLKVEVYGACVGVCLETDEAPKGHHVKFEFG